MYDQIAQLQLKPAAMSVLHKIKIAAIVAFIPTSLFGQLLDTILIPPAPGECNGQIELTLDQFFAPYEINWLHGDTGRVITDLCAGEYLCQIEDGLGCQDTLGPFLLQCNSIGCAPIFTFGTIQDTCIAGSPASVEVNISNNGCSNFSWQLEYAPHLSA